VGATCVQGCSELLVQMLPLLFCPSSLTTSDFSNLTDLPLIVSYAAYDYLNLVVEGFQVAGCWQLRRNEVRSFSAAAV